MNALFEGLKKNENMTTTENGANAYKSTNSALVDLMGCIGASRNQFDKIISMFEDCMKEDELLATKLSFYARNIRGGLGERETARCIWKYMANNYSDIMSKNMIYIPEFGRWDDMWSFIDTPCEESMWKMVSEQWNCDLESMKNNKPVSLLAKWIKKPNCSNKKNRDIGKRASKKLGYVSDKTFRKDVSALRKYLDVVEVKMSGNRWGDIIYPTVPSRAMMNYKKAFNTHDEERFNQYLDSVKKGENKINSGTLYPVDLFKKVRYTNRCDDVIEEQWKSLPNYVDEKSDILIMADTSGSMFGDPIDVAISLAIYFAERNKGAFRGHFMTFSEKPEFVEVCGDSLYKKYKNAIRASWGMNTNIEAAFKLILDIAIQNNISQEDMPKALIIISDMQFDALEMYGTRIDNSLMDTIVLLFENAGYKMPNLVYWNVNSRQTNYQAISEVKGVQIVSGYSTSIFKQVLDGVEMTAYESMVKTLSNPMYDCIKI